ncbi:MAG: ribonuclease P [Candidatus Altiarchaeota archaeon]|nr:ribonuclease P [Candidatus Altiarchaeota archaeon]
MNNRRGNERHNQGDIASERINRLMAMAQRHASMGDLSQADYMVSLARRISMKAKSPIPKELKNNFCRHCYRYMQPGRTSRTVINSKEGRVETICLKCGGRRFYRIEKSRLVTAIAPRNDALRVTKKTG